MSGFGGFTESGLELLAQLPSFDRDRFKSERPQYERELLDPAKAFVVAVGDLLQADVSPDLNAEPKVNGSLSPINNDLRFNPDRPPYKDHLLFNFWEGTPKKLAPTLRIRLTPTLAGFATGAIFDKAGLQRWREGLAGAKGSEFAARSERLAEATGADVAGQELKKVPAPYPSDHPRGELLRFKSYQLRWQEDLPPSVHEAGFAGWCVDRLERAAPLHHWLVDLVS